MFDFDQIWHERCPVDGGTIKPLFKKRTPVGEFEIVACTQCRFAFVNPTPTLAFIIEFYAKHGHGDSFPTTAAGVLQQEADDPNSTIDAQRITTNLYEMTGGGAILDVGCGHGLFSLAARTAGFDVDSIEIAETERRIAKEILGSGPSAVSFEDFESGRRYNAIILSQVLEHAREPVAWLAKIHGLLAPDGIVAIALPNFGSIFTDILKSRDPFVIPPAHLNYFNANNLARMGTLNGFDVIKSETLTRILRRAFTRRFGRIAGATAHKLASALSPALDLFSKGNMLNVYLRRRG